MINNQISPEFVERYQIELQKNPKSKVFAPLAEAYRKMGLVQEALRICKRGVEFNPDFAGGRVAFAKLLIDQKDFVAALGHLEKASDLSPDNLLAHSLQGETLLELRRPKDALKAFKMVLFLNPNDEKAKAAVRKWEFLTADDYDDEMFEMKPTFKDDEKPRDELDARSRLDIELEDLLDPKLNPDVPGKNMREDLAQRHQRALERAISLADAFTIRNDLESALEIVGDARRLLGDWPELETRHRLLTKRLALLPPVQAPPEPEGDDPDAPEEGLDFSPTERKRAILQRLLRRINDRRVDV